MHAGLLSGADADGLSVLHIADRIGLGIFQRNKGDLHVHQGIRGDLFVGGHHVGEKFVIDVQLVASLLKSDAVDLLSLQRSRYIIRIDLDYIVISFFLLFQDLQRFVRISGSDDSVGYFALDQLRGICVADVGKSDKISERGHAVSASGSCVCACQRRKFSQVSHPVDFCQRIGQR